MALTLSLVLSVSFLVATHCYPGEVIHACAYDDAKIHLTFDDGPTDNNRTDIVLDILKEYNISATFFVLGGNANRSEETRAKIRRMVAEGHTVGSHSWSHPNFLAIGDGQEMNDQVDRTTEVLQPLIGYKPNLFRAPYGGLTEALLRHLQQEGYTAVQWNTGNVDWYYNSADRDYNTSNEATMAMHSRSGGIITMHDRSQGQLQGVSLRNLIEILTNDTSYQPPFPVFNGPNFKIVSLLECISREHVDEIPSNYQILRSAEEGTLNARNVYIVGSCVLTIALIAVVSSVLVGIAIGKHNHRKKQAEDGDGIMLVGTK